MPRYTSAGPHDPAAPGRTGVLLVQLGTPEAPEPGATRRYLRAFLSDPRVVEIPRLVWWPILHGLVLPLRPRRSAAKYARIWMDEGSPLAVYTARQALLLRGLLGERGLDVDVAFAMRYGEPSIDGALRALRERGLARLLVLPLYPQYAGSTTATALDAVFRELSRWRDQPELRTVRSFHDQPAYLEALAARVRAVWADGGPPDRLVMSFHGVPRRTIELGDPYQAECLATGRLLAARLGLPEGRAVVSFQSRFGKAEWLQPYTDQTLRALAREGAGRVDVVCPGFVADCLETLEEIAMEGRDDFLAAGGQAFRYVPCPNDSPAFIAALADLVQAHTAGWPVARRVPAGQAGMADLRRAG